MDAVSTIRSRYYRAARQVGAPDGDIMFATRPRLDGGPYVELRRDAYAYVVWERGEEIACRMTKDPDEILYWLISDLTFTMATDYELSHRRADRDSRQVWMDKQLELLAAVDPQWSARKRIEYAELLRDSP